MQSLKYPKEYYWRPGWDDTLTRAVPRIPLHSCCLLHATTMNCYLSLYLCGMQGLGNTTAGSWVFILPVMRKCCMGPICALVPTGNCKVHFNIDWLIDICSLANKICNHTWQLIQCTGTHGWSWPWVTSLLDRWLENTEAESTLYRGHPCHSERKYGTAVLGTAR